MEPVALDPHCIEAPLDRQKPGHSRHGAVKRRVEAGHLKQFRMTLAERLDQFNLTRQMFRVVRADPMQFIQHLLRNTFRLSVSHAVDHSVSDCLEVSKIDLIFKPIDQTIRAVGL